jgi:hypothetical protein
MNPNPQVPELSQIGDMCIADLDGDNIDETLVQRRPHCRLSVVTADGSIKWKSDRLWRSWGTAWSIAKVTAGNFTSNSGLEVAVGGHDGVVFIFDNTGEQLQEQQTDIPILDISANRDVLNLHALRLEFMTSVHFIDRPQNALACRRTDDPVWDNLEKIAAEVDAITTDRVQPGTQPAWVII